MSLGYNRLNPDPCAYFQRSDNNDFIFLHVEVPISTSLSINFKLSSSMCPSNEIDRKVMSQVSYALTVGSLMFAMICTKPDIVQVVEAISPYMEKP